jgi:hypothetical protein
LEEYTIERLKKAIEKFKMSNLTVDEIVEDIDKDMIPIIIELNEKNWITEGCCSGHLEQIEETGWWSAYLCFSNFLKNEPKDIPLFDLNKKKNKNFSKFDNKISYSYFWSGKEEKDRKQLMNDLLDWSKKLPVNNDLEAFNKQKQYINEIKNNLFEDLGFIAV